MSQIISTVNGKQAKFLNSKSQYLSYIWNKPKCWFSLSFLLYLGNAEQEQMRFYLHREMGIKNVFKIYIQLKYKNILNYKLFDFRQWYFWWFCKILLQQWVSWMFLKERRKMEKNPNKSTSIHLSFLSRKKQ